ncbi:MAG: hypothetical protein OQL08_10545 [Gammaproteobacteria bacterium]|nr:hypothetical protein [Gammaproteobacteria bacterium]
MADPARRLLLRVSVKLFGLTALLGTAYILFSGDDEGATPATAIAPLLIELNTLQPAQAQRLTWAGGDLQLLRMRDDTPPLLFRDRGGTLNCPLSWHPPGAPQAPQQPWPGGFRDQCSNVWYRYDGQVLPGQVSSRGLQAVPYRLQGGRLLVAGGNGDNATQTN